MIYTVGHKTPDLDSIVGAISISYLLNQIGKDATPVRMGELNPEAKFVIEKFNLDIPGLKTSFVNEEVFIVDTTDLELCADDIKEAKVIGVVDHHKLGNLVTSTPLEAWIRPVGCSNTIVKEMYDFHGVDIPKSIAAAMMCAILIDTVIFKSPTCTPTDVKAVKDLAKIAEIEDFKALGVEMYNLKSKIKGTPIRDLILRDFKEFNMSGTKVGMGQLEVVDLAIFDDIKDDLIKDLKSLKDADGYHTIVLLLTDIMKEGSQMLVASDDEILVQNAFDTTLNNHSVWIDKLMSRKKQVTPNLENAFAR